MEQQIRRKQINYLGEWEYECSVCELWLPKSKFRGCKNYIDAYGNCLMCSSCRAKKSQVKKLQTEKEMVDDLLISMGYDIKSEKPDRDWETH